MGRAWVAVVLVVVVFILLLLQTTRGPGGLTSGPASRAGYKIGVDLPDPRLTPGDVLTTDTNTICRPGYTKTVRNVPSSVKNAVYREYGIATHQPREYEVDHLISLELGGSNSIQNLWPQSYQTTPLNAHVKDKLENRLHSLVCSGQVPIQEAQRAIAQDWIGAYQKYLGPLP